MTHTISPAEFQELGRSYYKKKQYHKALEAFTSGIEASVIPTVTLYDYRAAVFEKLADFNSAVKDGREAIRLNKRDVKGYLRTGSALQKLNKLDTAVNIYKYGMKNVPVDNRDFQLLQQLHNKLTRKLAPAKAIDPFTVLPVELMEMVLGYMPFKNMVNCLRVCRGWKSYLIKRRRLWQHLDLSGATKPVSRVFIRHAVQYSENAVTRLTVHRFQHTDVLRNIATTCKSLHTLEILSLPLMLSDTLIEVAQCATNLKKLIIHADVSTDTAAQIVRYRPTLEHVEFTSIQSPMVAECKGPFPNLHTVQLNAKPKATTASLRFVESLVSQAPALQSLGVANWGPPALMHVSVDDNLFTNPLTTLTLKNVHVLKFPYLPPTLKRLVFHPKRPLALALDPNPVNVDESWNNALHSRTERIEHLTIKEVLNLSPQFLSTLLEVYTDESGELKSIEQPESLRLLSLSGQLATPMRLFGENGLCFSSRMVTDTLASLNLSTMSCTDDDIEALLTFSTSIQSIDVSATKITGASVKMLADGLPNLRYLKADNCPNISSRDAVAYAEKRGIVVSCKTTDSYGGKKVRYG